MKNTFLLFIFFSFIYISNAKEMGFTHSNVGIEKQIFIPNIILEKVPTQGDQLLRINLWESKEKKGTHLAFWGLKKGEYNLNQWLISADSNAFSYPVVITSFMTNQDDGTLYPIQDAWYQQWKVPGYRFWYTFALIVWCGLFSYILFLRTKNYFQAHRKKVFTDESFKLTLFEKLKKLISNCKEQSGVLHPSDASMLYLLVISCWCKKYNWGAHQRVGDLYPNIHADLTLSQIHGSLQKWLFSNGPIVDFEVLLNSCKLEEKEQDNDV